ncbi:hypothetical protein GCM10022409_03430 [Hymenobacter glaciei]|uniref:Uncharacterized protein n=1 Tax=Hymenobacter glaciei TaxID=877209 RepID=A0ABP7T986_9BACT
MHKVAQEAAEATAEAARGTAAPKLAPAKASEVVYMGSVWWRRNMLRLVVERTSLRRVNNISNDETQHIASLHRVHPPRIRSN